MEKKLNYLFGKDIYNVYLIRHPEVENFEKNVFNGTIDVDLSPNGYKQADELFEFFKTKEIGVVYTSPLKRCKIVAEKLGNFCDVVEDSRLRERAFGLFESLSWSEIEENFPEEARNFLNDPFNYRPEGGESFRDVEERVKEFLGDLMKSIKCNVVIVAHGGVNRVIIMNLLGMKRDYVLRLSQDYACVNHFMTDGDFVLAKLINGKVC